MEYERNGVFPPTAGAATPTSPLSPPQRSLFTAARHQLAQQLAMSAAAATSSATKRARKGQMVKNT